MHIIKFRVPASEDFATINAINQEVQKFPWTEGVLKEELAHKHPYSRVAVREGVITGYIFIRGNEGDYEVMSVAVPKKFQRQGLGWALVRSTIEKIKKGRLHLEVAENNTPAIELYKRLGFTKSRVRSAYYPDGTGALEMVLEIT